MMHESGASSAATNEWPTPVMRFTIRTLLLYTTVVALNVAVYSLWLRNTRLEAQAREVVVAMKQVQLGLMGYDNRNGALPPAVHEDATGQPLSSWRFRIAAFA